METLGQVRVFGNEDRELVRNLAVQLYRIVPYESRTDSNGPIRLRNRIRRFIFRLLRPHKPFALSAIPTDGARVQKVLLFRYDALGDYITTTSIIEWLIAAIPGVTIDVVGSYRNQSLLESDPRIRRVIAINPSHGIRPSWLRVRSLGKNEDYDVVIAAVFTQMTKAAILTRLASRRALTVTIRHDAREAIYGQVFDVQVPHHSAEHWVQTMARVGPSAITPVQSVPENIARPLIPIDVAAVQRVRSWLSVKGLAWGLRQNARTIPNLFDLSVEDMGRPYVVVNISAYSPNRQWKADSCISVINMLRTRCPNLSVLVSGAPSEKTEVANIVSTINSPHVHQWSGSVVELLPLIAGARQLISPDTATIHVAAAAMVPCTVLFAELIKVAEWCPFGVPFKGVLSADPTSINGIPAETIVTAVVDLLDITC